MLKPRALSQEFYDDVKDGILSPLLARVQNDRTLCLELRGESINVYYAGGSLARVTANRGTYAVKFDANYRGGEKFPSSRSTIKTKADASEVVKNWPFLKQAMDLRPKSAERAVQQLIVRDNNVVPQARATDYYVCDIEYVAGKARFDVVGVHWPSTPADRKMTHDRRLFIGEVKFWDAAMDGRAGLHRHIKDVNAYLAEDLDRVRALKDDMMNVFNQKRRLGLVRCERNLESFSNEKPLLLLLLANHDPGKSSLRKLLSSLPRSEHAEVRLATSSLLGYGLFDQGVLTVDEAYTRFGDCI